VQPLDGVGVEIGATPLETREAQKGQHVPGDLLVDAVHLHLDAGRVRERRGQQRSEHTHREPPSPPVPSTSSRLGNALHHLNV